MADVVVGTTINVLTASSGSPRRRACSGCSTPVLLPLLVLAVLPDAWAAIRSARMRYTTMYALIPAMPPQVDHRGAAGGARAAAEVRSFTMRGFLMRMYDAVATAEQDVLLSLARRQTFVKIAGEALGGSARPSSTSPWACCWPSAGAAGRGGHRRTGDPFRPDLPGQPDVRHQPPLRGGPLLHRLPRLLRRRGEPAALRAPGNRRPRHSSGSPPRTSSSPTRAPSAPALQGMSIDHRPGEVIALVGENGSGKTTLAKILSGLYEPDSGGSSGTRPTWPTSTPTGSAGASRSSPRTTRAGR